MKLADRFDLPVFRVFGQCPVNRIRRTAGCSACHARWPRTLATHAGVGRGLATAESEYTMNIESIPYP